MKSSRSEAKSSKSTPEPPRSSRKSTLAPSSASDAPKLQHSVSAPVAKDSSNNIKVVGRFRPKNEHEEQLDGDKPPVCKHLSSTSILIGDETFTFDRIFDSSASQVEVFETVGKPVAEDVLAGYNGTVFAYGQTGSGKTYSMMGVDVYDERKRGMIPRAASTIFDKVNESDSEVEFILRCSMLEIYKETLRDLLGPEGTDLRIKEDPRKGIYVQGLTEVFVTSEEEMLEVISIGEQMRTVSATKCNAVSSRSHQLFMMEVKQRFPNDSEKRGILNLVDLAGSEKINHSGVTGNNLQEAKKINLSLSALGNVIHSLMTGSDHVPYRDSKLTRLLQESLGGNYKTTLLVALSPSPRHYDETFNSLKFAQRAKHIKTKASINMKSSPETYQILIEKLTEELHRTQAELQMVKSSPRTMSGSLQMSDGETSANLEKVPMVPLEEFRVVLQTVTEQQDKIRFLEDEKHDLVEKAAEIQSDLKSSNKKLLREQKEGLEYKAKYHKAIMLMRKESDEIDLLRKYNAELSELVKKLRAQLEELDEKFSRILNEKQRRDSSTILEFDDRLPDSPATSLITDSEDFTINGEIEVPAPPKMLTLAPEETTQKYFDTVKICLQPESTLTKESMVRQLQNSLLQTVRAYAWKNEVLSHTYAMKSEYAKHLGGRVRAMEDLLDQMQKSYNSVFTLMEKVGGVDVSRVSQESYTPKARVMKPLMRSVTSRRLDFFSGHSSKDRSSLDKSHSFNDSEEAAVCSRLRNYEATLQMQQNYTIQLKAELEEVRKEAERTKLLAAEMEKQMENDRKDERGRWTQYIEEYRMLTLNDLQVKDQEISKLNEVLSAWVDRYLQLEELIPHQPTTPVKHRRTQSVQYIEDMRELCGWTVSATQRTKPKPNLSTLTRKQLPLKAISIEAGPGDDTPSIHDID